MAPTPSTHGYWGPHVGFYGGVNYGYGYGGSGYDGGRWNGDNFAYNRSANNFGAVSVPNTYQQNAGRRQPHECQLRRWRRRPQSRTDRRATLRRQ